MMDNELKRMLSRMQDTLLDIRRNLGGPWVAFYLGAFRGMGAIIGAIFIVVLLGWILNIVGVIPAFQAEVDEVKQILEGLKR